MPADDQSFNPPPSQRSTSDGWTDVAPQATERPKSGTPKLASIALVVLFVVSGMFAAFAGGMIFERSVTPQIPPPGQEAPDDADAQDPTATFARAWQVVIDHYVDEPAIDEELMLTSAIQAMLATLGDEGHTRFMTAEQTAQDRENIGGSYVGIGILVEETDEGEYRVVTPFEGSPAFEAGILPGDVITAVDGVPVSEQTLQQVIGQIRGIEGTQVDVTFRLARSGEEVTFQLIRSRITISSVNWVMLDNNIAILRLSQFTTGSGDDMARALREIQAAGAESLVLDLRNNPGGFIVEAMQVASMFVPDDSVVFISQTRDGGQVARRSNRQATHIGDMPFVVLINEGSASSSEIVSGAIRSARVSTIVGETTSGTGTILNQFELGDGSTIWLGVELWLTPEGDMIREDGIRPDVVISMRDGQIPFRVQGNGGDESGAEINDAQLEYAIRVLMAGQAGSPRPNLGDPISRMN